MPLYFKPEENKDWVQFLGSPNYTNFSKILYRDKAAIYEKFMNYYENISTFINQNYPKQKNAIELVINLDTTQEVDNKIYTEQLKDSINFLQ